MLDIAIIGGGPAGLSAGLYAARGGATAMLFEELYAGGQATKTHLIDNYPGFSDGIEGFTLANQLEQHAVRFGLSMAYETVDKLELTGTVKKIHMGGRVEETKSVILAMGATPRPLGLDREKEFIGKGLSYCATCDGAFFKGKDVAVIGGGDTAISDALYLANFAKTVYVIHRRDRLRATETLQQAAKAEPKIKFFWNSVVQSLSGTEKLEAITIRDITSDILRPVMCEGVFVAVGIEPRTELIKGQLELASDGSVKTDSRMQTSIPGVFAAGDIRDTVLRQVVTACADGAISATGALEFCRGI